MLSLAVIGKVCMPLKGSKNLPVYSISVLTKLKSGWKKVTKRIVVSIPNIMHLQ